MYQSAHDAYLENRVLSAHPLQLVQLLYGAAISSVQDARRHLAAGEIGLRSRAINKASEILAELAGSLDHERGGELSRRLAELYDYMLRRLTEANFKQADEPMADVLGLLTTLAEAWNTIAGQAASEEPKPGSGWAMSEAGEAMATSASQGWSL